MPSSDPMTIPKVLSAVKSISPNSILDVGVGNGRYGFLFRECLDWNYGRINKRYWNTVIEGVEVEKNYLTDIHKYCYDNVIIGDWLEVSIDNLYDLVFMGDVLEHWPDGEWQLALNKAIGISKATIVVCPNCKESMSQEAWYGYERERHRVVLSPKLVGGQCLFANSKVFMCAFDNHDLGFFDSKDICL